MNAEVAGCSIDSHFVHKAWVQSGVLAGGVKKLDYPLIADLTKNIARDYGVLKEDLGATFRGTFLIDPDGVVQQYSINGLGVGRDTNEILRELAGLQMGKPCPVNWKKGDATL